MEVREPDRGRPSKTWKEVVDKDMDDLYLKPSDTVDCSQWREVMRELEQQ